MSNDNQTITPQAQAAIASRYGARAVEVMPVSGGYSYNRRAVVYVGDMTVFAKEVDDTLVEGDGMTERKWLSKDYGVMTALRKCGITCVPEWAELVMDGDVLLLPAYAADDGWLWQPPTSEPQRTRYIDAVVAATQQLERVQLPDDMVNTLALQPFYRDEMADSAGAETVRADAVLRERLIAKYRERAQLSPSLGVMYDELLVTLQSDERLRDLQAATQRLRDAPNDCFNHCDVRSDNVAYNDVTGEVKLVDWNWASYAPARFGATEFLLDMARRGADVAPWKTAMSRELLASFVGFYLIRSSKPPRHGGEALRAMQAETAAVANYLYYKVMA